MLREFIIICKQNIFSALKLQKTAYNKRVMINNFAFIKNLDLITNIFTF